MNESCDERDAIIDALFASDLAKDVRSEFNALREDGQTVHDATAAVLAHFRGVLDDAEEGPVVIIVMALLQLFEGAPTATLRDAALELLRQGYGSATGRGEKPSRSRDRQRFHAQLIEMLEAAPVDPNPAQPS